jgi:hypothetical protein
MSINSIAIKQIIGAWAFDSSDDVKWMCSQVENLQITQDGETTEKKDANGSTIFTIDRNKSCKITFDSSVLDLALVAALNGTEKIEATNEVPIRTPYIERFELKAADVSNGYVALAKTPVAEVGGGYKISFHTLTEDNSLESNYAQVGSAATSTKFYYDSTNNRIYFPTDTDVFKAGCKIEVIYEMSVTAGVKVTNAADKFPDAAKVRMLVLAVDLCDQTKVRALWITAKNAKPETGNTIGFNLDDTISVSLNLAYSYCDKSKDFYEITVADETFTW